MSLTLILTRHGKSDWDAPGGDHARPLNARGRAAAGAVAGWLAEKEWRPELVLSSDALRTRQTWAQMAPRLGAVPVDWRRRLYLAEPGTMLRVLREAGRGRRVLLLLGHNPGIAQLAQALLAEAPAHPRFADFPTCATLVARFDAADWGAVRSGSGRVLDFVVPREL
jgi:phosphohistidine phosphatase